MCLFFIWKYYLLKYQFLWPFVKDFKNYFKLDNSLLISGYNLILLQSKERLNGLCNYIWIYRALNDGNKTLDKYLSYLGYFRIKYDKSQI